MWSGWSPCAPPWRETGPRKLAILEATEADTARIQEDLDRVSRDRAANQEKTGEARQAPSKPLDARPRPRPEKPGPEREAQDKNKSILTMERACALLEQKK